MNTSQMAIDMIKSFEGCRLDAYKCPAWVWTIGYGHTGKNVYEGLKITPAEAEALLRIDLEKYEKAVEKVGTFTQPQFDALVSFAYNCGIGNLQKLTRGRDHQQIADAILLYNKAGGRVLAGLTRRRRWEHDLFLSGTEDKPGGNLYPVPSKTLRKGSKGDDVRWLQYELNTLGYRLIIDGRFGVNTENAVKEFQHYNGLTVDGIVGSKTVSELIKH